MESGTNNGHAVILRDSSWFAQFRNAHNPWMARFVYALIFLLANLLAWAARDYGHAALSELQRVRLWAGEPDCSGVDTCQLGMLYIVYFKCWNPQVA